MKRINITCPACGSRAYLRPASVVYGDKAPDPDAKYYVCGRYPACDCYVAAHRKTMLPMGTLADKALRKKRHDAHVALDSLWKNGIMSRKEAYRRKKIFNFMIRYLCPIFAAIILVSSVANALGWIAM